MQIKEIKLTELEGNEQRYAVCWIINCKHVICMRSPLLLPDYEKGAPAAPPPKPEQVLDRQEPTPGTHRNTCASATLSHLQANEGTQANI